jgi:3-hydroxymyristoyl/3-hydroxydecanoyl-(acyl carrier protein) dehydratase
MDILKIQQILDIYPPFLFIDNVVDINPGIESITSLLIKENDWFFKSHLRTSPTMPGVLLTENMLQTCMLAIYAAQDANESKGLIHQFNVKLKEKISIRDTPIKIKTIATIQSSKRGLTKASCKIYNFESPKIFAEAEIVHFVPANLHP